MTTWVAYRDACGHIAVGYEGDAVFNAVEHTGSLYGEFLESFEKRSDANSERVLDSLIEKYQSDEEEA